MTLPCQHQMAVMSSVDEGNFRSDADSRKNVKRAAPPSNPSFTTPSSAKPTHPAVELHCRAPAVPVFRPSRLLGPQKWPPWSATANLRTCRVAAHATSSTCRCAGLRLRTAQRGLRVVPSETHDGSEVEAARRCEEITGGEERIRLQIRREIAGAISESSVDPGTAASPSTTGSGC